MDQVRRIRSFLLLAFGFTWSVAGIGWLAGIDTGSHMSYTVLAAICMLGPAFAALVQLRYIDRAPWSSLGLQPERIHWRSLIGTSLLGMMIIPICLLVIHVLGDRMAFANFGHVSITGERFATAMEEITSQMGGVSSSSSTALLSSLPGGLILLFLLVAALLSALTFNLPFMLGEELGWRGYLYQATENWSTGRRIALTGSFWGLWHAPLILMGHNYPGFPLPGIPLMIVFCLLLAVLFDWCRTRVRSVWGPCILHGLINGTAGAFALFAWDGHVLIGSPVGLAGFIAIVLLIVLLLLLDGSYRRSLTGRAEAIPSGT